VVDAVRPVFENEVPVNPLAIWLLLEGAKPDVVLLYTSYVMEQPTPAVLAVQLRLIWLDDAAVAVSPIGTVGTVVHIAPGMVVALAWLDAADEPPAFTASTK
jgi:hypothetical protein